ncbi:rod shape-determining protein MreC [Candidatus Falkowbacteria bacterium]|nr:rod shape-determining protein MreC [Candidatus Falkowbacteria bacterium]
MKKVNWKRVGYFGAVIGLLIFLHYLKVLAPLESRLHSALNPVLGRFYAAGAKVRLLYNSQTDRRDLASAAEELTHRVNRLTEENARLKALENENETLREFLKFKNNNGRKTVLAAIIGKSDLDQANQTVMLDRGSKDGLALGLAVLNEDGHIFGKVIDTTENSAQVCLVTSSQCQFAVAIQNKSRTIGIAKGDLGLTVKMELIPQSEVIKNGNVVVTSGLERNIPGGIVVGSVSQVIKENNELWQDARIEPMIGIDDTMIVSVLLSK